MTGNEYAQFTANAVKAITCPSCHEGAGQPCRSLIFRWRLRYAHASRTAAFRRLW